VNCRSPQGNVLYYTSPLGSGMDNTPRIGVGKGAWIDVSCQQALAAKSIAEIAEILGQGDVAHRFSQTYEDLAAAINRESWNPETSFYHDRLEEGDLSTTKHIGAYWALLSEVCRGERVTCLAEHLRDPHEFWRPHLVPTLSADDPFYDPRGHYWRGSVWGPTNYMLTAGLTLCGFRDIAYSIASNHLSNIAEVYSRFSPNEGDIAFEERYDDAYQTIWECYAPEVCAPATRWDGTFYARQDFVGWSGLGPIAMLIEQVLGIEILGCENRIHWHVARSDRHGIERIRLRDQTISLICTPHRSGLAIFTRCEKPFDLSLESYDKTITRQIPAGEHEFFLER
jgi:glycogen debranching enzyme